MTTTTTMTPGPRRRWARPCAAGVAVVVALGLGGCGGGASKASSAAASPVPSIRGAAAAGAVSGLGAAPAPAPGGSSSSQAAPAIGQEVVAGQPKIVTNGDVHLQVRPGQLQQAFDALAGVATGAGGFVSDSSMSSGSGTPSARVVLRVASAQVDRVLLALHQDGKVTSQSLSGQDVTGQVVDLAARITTLQAEENALRTLLGSAKAIGDILSIQNQLFDLQTQIEQLTGQQDVLASQTAFATISVEVTEIASPPPPFTVHHPAGTLARAWHLAGAHTVAVLRAVVLALGWLAPALVAAAAIGVPTLVLWRHRRRPAVPDLPEPTAG